MVGLPPDEGERDCSVASQLSHIMQDDHICEERNNKLTSQCKIE